MLGAFYHWLDENIKYRKDRVIKLSEVKHDTSYPKQYCEGYLKALQDVRNFFEPEIDEYE